MPPEKGRLVLNHSTHIERLIPYLQKLIHVPGIRTITPGAIATSKGKSPQMQLRISVPIQGGFKLIARRGRSVQEVFVLTTLNEQELTAEINQILR
jgi:hypothetical protein